MDFWGFSLELNRIAKRKKTVCSNGKVFVWKHVESLHGMKKLPFLFILVFYTHKIFLLKIYFDSL